MRLTPYQRILERLDDQDATIRLLVRFILAMFLMILILVILFISHSTNQIITTY